MEAGFQEPGIGGYIGNRESNARSLGSCLVDTLAMPKRKMWIHKKIRGA